MIHWGITALNHGSSLAVFKDGHLLSLQSSAEDELPRSFIRKQLDNGAPNRIFWYERPWVKKARQLCAGQYRTALDLSVLPRAKLKDWSLHYAPVTYTSHHASHAAAGYYTSPFNHCAVVVVDAIGEFESATVWNCSHGEMTKVWSRSYPHSLGLFYSAFTKLVGLTPIKDEYLLQEMAAQGDALRYSSTMSNYMRGLVESGYNMHRGILNWPHEINNLQDQCDIAAAVQAVFEQQIQLIMRRAKELTNADCLVYMGGCAMNSKANRTIVEPMWRGIWSLPNPGDPSSSVGAVLYHTQHREWDYKWDPVKHIEIRV